MAHRNPLLLSTLLSCWITRDLLLRTCTHSTIHSMLVLTLPFAFFREPPPSTLPVSAHYAIPSLPSPLQWRSPSASLTADIRPQSPGSVRSVLPQSFWSICFSRAALPAIFLFSFRSRSHQVPLSSLTPPFASPPPLSRLFSAQITLSLCSSSSAAFNRAAAAARTQSQPRPVCLHSAACVCPVSFSLVAGVCFERNSTSISKAFKLLSHSQSRVTCLNRRLCTSSS